MKKVILILAFVALLVTVAGTAQAGMKYYNATITYAGCLTGGENLYLNVDSVDDVWAGNRWFVVTGNQYKVQLATALTAYSMSVPVLLVLEETDLDEWSPCYGIFIAPQQ